MIQSQGDFQQGFVDRSDVDERGTSSVACTSMTSKTGVCAPRVLLDVERTLLLEDLKYAGVPVGVLKSLIAKIEEAEPLSPTVLTGLGFNGDELNAYQLLMRRLGMMGAVLPEQAVVQGARSEGMQETEGRLTHIKWREPDDELKGTVDLVSRLLGADSDLLPRDILVVAPGAVQCGALCEGFSRRHLAYQYVAPHDAVYGDPRRLDRQGSLGAYAALSLAADLYDCAAWRLWLSLGQDDFGCRDWASLLECAQAEGLAVTSVIAGLAVDGTSEPEMSSILLNARLSEVVRRIREGSELAEYLSAKRGFALRGALEKRFPRAGLRQLFERIDDGDDAIGLRDAVREQSRRPAFGNAPEAVHVCTYANRPFQGITHRYVFALGLVEGLVPPTASLVMGAPNTGRCDSPTGFHELLALASDEAFISCFQRADEDAIKCLRLPQGRVRRCQGREMAVYAQSSLLVSLGDMLPGSVSAEQYLAQKWGV